MRSCYVKAASLALLIFISEKNYASDDERQLSTESPGLALVHFSETSSDTTSTSQVAVPDPLDYLSELPVDLKYDLCSFFPTHREISAMSQVSTEWRAVINGYIIGSTLIIGKFYDRRSELFHFMAGSKRLIADNGIPMGYDTKPGVILVLERSPGPYSHGVFLDRKNREIVFDCPDFDLGTIDEFNRVSATCKLLQSLKMKTRVILVSQYFNFMHPQIGYPGLMDLLVKQYFNFMRPQIGFPGLMDLLVNMFPDIEQLKSMLHLVMMKADPKIYVELPPATSLLKHMLEHGNLKDFSDKARELLYFLVTQPNRLAHFHHIEDPEAFVPRQELTDLIDNRIYAEISESTHPQQHNIKESGDVRTVLD